MIRRPILPRRSARLRLTLWYGGIVLLSGFTLLSLTYVLVNRSLRGDPGGIKTAIERQLARHVHEVAEPSAQGDPSAENRNAGFPDGLPARFFQVDGPVEVITIPSATPDQPPPGILPGRPDGRPLAYRSKTTSPSGVATIASKSRAASPTPTTLVAAASGTAARSSQYTASATTVPGAAPPASPSTSVPEYVAILPAVQRGTIAQVMHQLVQQSAVALALLAIVSLMIGWIMAGRVLRPVKEITATARRLSERNLHERIALQGPNDELRELADTFDAMLSRLDSAFALQRDFVANASHELRTPLTIIRTDLDVTMADPDASIADYQAMAATIHDATVRSERLIDALMTLARTDGPVDRSSLDLATVVRSAALPLLDLRARGLRVETSLASAPVAGDLGLLERLVANLVENAIRYNRANGWISVETRWLGNQAVITVANSGDRIDPAEVALLCQRFYRRDRSRSRATGGAGLGLSIVDAVVRVHGGALEASALADGGLQVTVVLPAAAAAPDERYAGHKDSVKGPLTTPLTRVP